MPRAPSTAVPPHGSPNASPVSGWKRRDCRQGVDRSLITVGWLLCAVSLWGESGCHSTAPARPLAAMSPWPQVVAQNAWTAAEEMARAVPGGTVLVGLGSSMMPLYPDGTVLVVQRVAWSQLQAGMTVVYVRTPGTPAEVVGHVLMANQARGWVTQGLNNREPDTMLMTPENYLGAVVAAFHGRTQTAERPERAMMAMAERANLEGKLGDSGGLARTRDGGSVVWLAAVQ